METNHPDWSNGISDDDVRVAGFDPDSCPSIYDEEDPRNWDVIYEDGEPIAR